MRYKLTNDTKYNQNISNKRIVCCIQRTVDRFHFKAVGSKTNTDAPKRKRIRTQTQTQQSLARSSRVLVSALIGKIIQPSDACEFQLKNSRRCRSSAYV